MKRARRFIERTAQANRLTADDVITLWVGAAQAVPIETRQAFLDGINGCRSIGDTRHAVGISFEAAMGVIQMNIINATGGLGRITK